VKDNPRSALRLGLARGVAILVCGQAGLALSEISALKVKQAVTGTGTADKKQVADMVSRLLRIPAPPSDAADALAIAIAAGHQAPIDIAAATNRTGVAPAARVGSTAKDTPQPGLSAAIERALARDAEKDNK
ncbi:MAG: crossover junction endodeoxyribonuclease RuvC, partial [Alphaproteobacteria bacterium]